MAKYAERTKVPPVRSREEIERTLTRYGATSFFYGREDDREIVGFKMSGKLIRFNIFPPNEDSEEIRLTGAGYSRSSDQIKAALKQDTRQRWRALALVVKAKLEAVESGITSFEEEFLAYILLPNHQTVIQAALPMIEKAYATGKMPRSLMPIALLPAPEED